MWTQTASTFRTFAAQRGPGAVRLISFAGRQPGWVAKLAIVAASLVVMAIVLLLVIPALVIGVVVFAAGALVAAARGRARALLGGWRGDGRQNVRVLARRESGL